MPELTGSTADVYCITITFKPLLVRPLESSDQYDYVTSYFHRKFRNYPDVVAVSMVTELTIGSDIHMHGFVRSKPGLGCRLFAHKLNNSKREDPIIGFIDVKEMKDQPGWVAYCTKEVEVTKQLLGRPPIFIDELLYFNHCLKEFGRLIYVSIEHVQPKDATTGEEPKPKRRGRPPAKKPAVPARVKPSKLMLMLSEVDETDDEY